MTRERQLESKGYKYYTYTDSPDKAKRVVKELRENGYYATVIERASRISGLHDFSIYRKSKNKTA